MKNILFVCNLNKHRSRTAEDMLKDKYNVKSAGILDGAVNPLTQELIDWADIVFVFEKRQEEFILNRFTIRKRIEVLDIPDMYDYGVPDLKELIKTRLKETDLSLRF